MNDVRAGTGLPEKSVQQGIRSTLAAQMVRIACKAVSLVIMPRFVPPEEHGMFALTASVILALSLARDLGIGRLAVQLAEIDEGLSKAIFRLHVFLGVGLSVASLVLGPVMATISGERQVVPLTAVCGVSMILLGISAWPRVMLMRDMRIAELNRIETLGVVTATAVMIVAALIGAGPYSFAAYLLAYEGMNVALTRHLLRWDTADHASWLRVKSMLKDGVNLTLQSTINLLAQQAELVAIGTWFGTATLGAYHRPLQLLTLTNTHIAAPLSQLLYANLARSSGSAVVRIRHFQSNVRLTGYLTLPALGLCIALPDELVLILFGERWLQTAELLPWLATSAAFAALAECVSPVCLASGQARRLLIFSAASAVFTAVALVLGRRGGAETIAASVAAGGALLAFPRAWWCLSGSEIGMRELIEAVTGPVLTAAVAGLAAAAARNPAEAESPSQALLLPIGASLAAVGLLAALPSMRKDWRKMQSSLELQG